MKFLLFVYIGHEFITQQWFRAIFKRLSSQQLIFDYCLPHVKCVVKCLFVIPM